MAAVERDYGIGKPMEMIMQSAPNAGEEGRRIWEKGMPAAAEIIISPDQEIGVKEAIRNSFSFVQIAGMRAGESSMVANISTGFSWDRQTPMEDAAQEIVGIIGGNEVQLVWFGPHKLVGLVKGDQKPEDKLASLVYAPVGAYERYFPNLARAQREIQRRRVGEILGSNGNGRKFLDIFNGEENLDRAYRDDGQYSFVWGTQKIDDMLVATNLDNKPQSITELATDEDTKQMLEAMQEFFKGTDAQNRYFIEFDFSQTASCVNISSNAQHGSIWAWDTFSFSNSDILKYPNGETYLSDKTCSSCHKEKENCTCKKNKEENKAKKAA